MRVPAALVATLLAACSGSTDDDDTAPIPDAGGIDAGAASDAGATPEDAGVADDTRGGCDGARFLIGDPDLTKLGPWMAGARTASIAGSRVEIWYPADPVSAALAEPIVYDIREQLPPKDVGKIPDEDNPAQPCPCVASPDIDARHGPYPIVLFVHGTGAFRHQSAGVTAAWASRGFVVVAMDHDGLKLGDVLQLMTERDLQGDIDALLAALETPEQDLAFLAGHIDTSRMGAAGHSAGGGAISGLGDRMQVLVPMAAAGTSTGSALVSTLVLGAADDGIVPFNRQVTGYEGSPLEKRLVALGNAGHLAFTDLCALRADLGGLPAIAEMYNITNASLARFLWDGCDSGQLSTERAVAVTRYVTTAVFEEVLTCRTNESPFDDLMTRLPEVVEFRAEP